MQYFLAVVFLLAWVEPVASQIQETTEMYGTDMNETTNGYTAAEAEGDNTGAGNVPQPETMNDNSASSNGSDIITGEVKPCLFRDQFS